MEHRSSKNQDHEDKSPTVKPNYKRQASNLSNNLRNNSNQTFSIAEMKDEPVVDNKFQVSRARALSKNANSPLIRKQKTTYMVAKADIVRVHTAERVDESGTAAQNHAPKIGDGLAVGVVQVKSQMKPGIQCLAAEYPEEHKDSSSIIVGRKGRNRSYVRARAESYQLDQYQPFTAGLT